MKTPIVAIFLLLGASAGGTVAQEHVSPYAHAGSDVVRTLSQPEVDALLEGAGMGRARPAEFNGLPGPRHVLELADSLSLTAGQASRVEAVFRSMDAEARALGRRVIAAEQALDALFAGGRPTGDAIREAVGAAADLEAALRMVHLEAHVHVAEILTEHQIHEYARLRGYRAHEHRP